jgi:hypothetical protein
VGNGQLRDLRVVSGRPEFYKLSDNVVNLSNLLSKPHIIDMIIEALEKSGLLSNFFKKVLMTSVLMLRDLDENNTHMLLKSVNPQGVPDLETFVKSMKPKREILLTAGYDTIETVVKPLINEWVSRILTKDNIMVRTIILLSLTNL